MITDGIIWTVATNTFSELTEPFSQLPFKKNTVFRVPVVTGFLPATMGIFATYQKGSVNSDKMEDNIMEKTRQQRRLEDALAKREYRAKLIHSKARGWLTVGMAALVLGGLAVFGGQPAQVQAATTTEVQPVWTLRPVSAIKAQFEASNKAEYKIQWGDTLSTIAQALNESGFVTSVDRLAEINHIADVNLIYAGATLYLNGSGENATVTTKDANGNDQTYNLNPSKQPVASQQEQAAANQQTQQVAGSNGGQSANNNSTQTTGNNGGSTDLDQNNNNSGTTTTPTTPIAPTIPTVPGEGTKPVAPGVKYATVTVLAKDTDGNTLGVLATHSEKVGSTVVLFPGTANFLTGYTLEDSNAKSITVNGDTTVTFIYKKDQTPVIPPVVENANVTTKYVDVAGNPIAKDLVESAKVGTDYTAKAITIDGYDLQGAATTTVKVSADGNTVTFVYRKHTVTPPATTKAPVTVKFVDANGAELAPAQATSLEVGSTYEAKAITIDGYDLQGAGSQTVTVAADGNTVTFVYAKHVTPVEQATVTTKFVDQNGKEIATAKAEKAVVGSKYQAAALTIPGYDLQGSAEQSVTVAASGNTITFTYKKAAVVPPVTQATVTVNYVDEAGKTLQAPASVSATVGSEYTATAPKIDGYSLKGDAEQTVQVNAAGNTITFVYSQNVAPIAKATVTTKFVDPDGKEIADPKTEQVNVGAKYTASAVTVPGYDLHGESTQVVTVAKEGNTITFQYAKHVEPIVKATVTTKYVDDSGKEIAPPKTEQADVDSAYEAKAITLDGYDLQGAATQTVTVSKNGNTVTFVYKQHVAPIEKATVTTKYVDGDGKDVAPAKSEDAVVGSQYGATAPSVVGYDLQGAATRSITVSKDGNTITFVYQKHATPVEEATVIVKYTDADGNELAPAKSEKAVVGSKYTGQAITIDGYDLQGASSQDVTVAKDGNTITFVYAKHVAPVEQATVTVKYMDDKGNKLADDKTEQADVDSSYTATALAIDGYDLNGESTQTVKVSKDGNTITFVYVKHVAPIAQAVVTTKYVDDKGNKLADDKSEKANVDADYTATAITIDGYDLQGTASQTVKVAKDGNTITFTYVKHVTPVAKAKVTIVAKSNVDGKVLQQTESDEVEVGKQYTATAPTIDGWTLQGDATQTVTVNDADNTVTFRYLPTPAKVDVNAVASALLTKLNAYRVSQGLTALTADANLSAGAMVRAQQEADAYNAGGLSAPDHLLPDGQNFNHEAHLTAYGSTNLAENLTVFPDRSGSADEVAEAALTNFKNSPAHNAAMLTKSFTDGGMGVAITKDGNFVVIQDMGGKIAENKWNANYYNTATPASLGITQQQIINSIKMYSANMLVGNYYIGAKVFKSLNDADKWQADSLKFTTQKSIWAKGSNSSIEPVYDNSYNIVAYAIIENGMDKSASDYFAQGYVDELTNDLR